MGVIFHYRVTPDVSSSAETPKECGRPKRRVASGKIRERLPVPDPRLVQWFVQAVRVENPVHQRVQLIDGHVPEALFPPIRQWAEPSFDLHTKDCELSGEQPTLVLPSQDCVLQEIDKDRHASYTLPFPLRSRDSESLAG